MIRNYRNRTRNPLQAAALAFGTLFLLAGILGFIPVFTSNLDALTFAGPESGAMLFGVLQVSILHNFVHIALGVAGFVASRSVRDAASYLLVAGAVNLVIWLYGMVFGHGGDADFLPINSADNWTHFLTGVIMIVLGMTGPGRGRFGRGRGRRWGRR